MPIRVELYYSDGTHYKMQCQIQAQIEIIK